MATCTRYGGSRELPIPLKRKLVQLMIWPIMSYGSETRIYLKSVQNMINVFERWCYRRMLRISWTEHATNEEVFNRANTKPPFARRHIRRCTPHGSLSASAVSVNDTMCARKFCRTHRPIVACGRHDWLSEFVSEMPRCC